MGATTYIRVIFLSESDLQLDQNIFEVACFHEIYIYIHIYIYILPSLIKDKQIFQNTPSHILYGLLTATHPQKVSKKRGL